MRLFSYRKPTVAEYIGAAFGIVILFVWAVFWLCTVGVYNYITTGDVWH